MLVILEAPTVSAPGPLGPIPYSRSRLELDHPPTPNPKKEGIPAEIILHPCSNFLKSALQVPGPQLFLEPLQKLQFLQSTIL